MTMLHVQAVEELLGFMQGHGLQVKCGNCKTEVMHQQPNNQDLKYQMRCCNPIAEHEAQSCTSDSADCQDQVHLTRVGCGSQWDDTTTQKPNFVFVTYACLLSLWIA